MDENFSSLNNKECNSETSKNGTGQFEPKVVVRKPNRTIIIEPLMIMHMLFGFPFMQVAQLFIYGRMEDYTLKKSGYNHSMLSHNNTNGSNCDVDKSSMEYQFTQEVQKYNSYFSIISSLCRALPTFFVMLFVGGYSDKCGRRYALVPPLIGGFVYTLIYLLVILLDLPVWSIWIGEFIDGAFGGSSLFYVGCYSYIADITTKEQRFFRMTIAEFISFFFGILGPIGVGYWIKTQGYVWPMVFTVGGHLIALLYVIFFIPETIIKDPNAKLFTLSHLRRSADVFTLKTSDNRRWKLWLLFLTYVIHHLASGSYGILSLFELNIPLCWESVTIGYYNTTFIAITTVGGIICAWSMKSCISDTTIAIIAALFCSGRSVYLGFVKNSIMMFISPIFMPVGMLLTPTTRTLMSKLVEQDEQGSVFGATGVIEVLVSLFSSEMFKLIYANTLDILTTLVFFIGAIFYFIVALIFMIYVYKLSKEKAQYKRLENLDEE